ncbi:TetR/AcrR family transcriptional regulator [Raineyella fluvialis]|uniref:TetR family transcriptional regulator n=1 Tax=Raineyella fluvialis TaxID=2662261 RepID=A0A5Q2FCM6_9ACTN|nr:TetR/AcrR family transcriptional regulator [Raineyella fluvialis]QGF22455.1 TetR family transcriptional regulator [Raineyella fluvialis]
METPESDLTARARIRDAALVEFGQRGEKGATIRTIAARAGVSPGLVQFHFGTKSGLRATCDAYVLEYLRTEVDLGIDQGGIGDPAFAAEALRTGPPVTRYLVRALIDGSPGADAMFDEVVDLTARYLRASDPSVPLRAKAAVMVAMKLGISAFAAQLSRSFGVDLYSPEGMSLSGRAQLDLLNPELSEPGIFEQARQSLPATDQEQS